jgi:hypothetical protein
MFQQAAIAVENPAVFGPVKKALEAAFAAPAVDAFLKRVDQSKLRVRDFEGVLGRGLLGAEAKADYAQLSDSDRGQIRELYLRLVERVALELRGKYFKVYSYY